MKHGWILGAFILSLGLTGCSRVELIQEEITMELGQSLSEDPSQYVNVSDENMFQEISMDLTEVDFTKAGDYSICAVYEEKEYPIMVHIQDTTPPEAQLREAYQILRPGVEVSAGDFFESVEDLSETETGFIGYERTGDLEVTADDALEALEIPEPDMRVMGSDEEFSQTLTLPEEGIYAVSLAARDSSGNAAAFILPIYVDGTAPTLPQKEDEEISRSEIFERLAEDLDNLTCADNFDDEASLSERIGFQADAVDDTGEALQITVSVTDRAGNEGKTQWKVTGKAEKAASAASSGTEAAAAQVSGPLIITDGEVYNQALVEEGLAKVPANIYRKFVNNGWHIILTSGSLGENVGAATFWSNHTIVVPDSTGDLIPAAVVHEMGHFLGGSTGTPWKSSEFAAIYAEEKDAFAATGGINASSSYSQMEFFAQVFCDSYTTGYAPSVAPKAYAFVQRYVNSM